MVPGVVHRLFALQLAYVLDVARILVLQCGRRAGKTYAIVTRLLTRLMANPRTRAIYLGLTHDSAKRLAWSLLKEIDEVDKLKIKFNENDLSATLPNGSVFLFRGADDERLANRLRGEKFIEAAVDECQSFRLDVLRKLIVEVLAPTLADVLGCLTLGGSPGLIKRGLWWELTRPGAKVSQRAWTIFENPNIKDPARAIREMCEQFSLTEQHPSVRREWFNEWVTDESGMVYAYSPERNRVSTIVIPEPQAKVLGIDFGFTSATAFAVLAFSYEDGEKRTQIIETEKKERLTPDKVGERILEFQERHSFDSIVGDAGGLGKAYIEQIAERYSIPIEPAVKSDKRAAIEMLNGDLIAGKTLVHENCTALLSEWEVLAWDDERKEEAPGSENHTSDAVLYAWRACRAFLGVSKTPERPYDDPEVYWERLDEQAKESAWERLMSD